MTELDRTDPRSGRRLSRPEHTDITKEQYNNRMILRDAMTAHGFDHMSEMFMIKLADAFRLKKTAQAEALCEGAGRVQG